MSYFAPLLNALALRGGRELGLYSERPNFGSLLHLFVGELKS